jgi:hypothetical protein
VNRTSSPQIDLFELAMTEALAAARPADAVHWLVVTTTLARTGCGILTYGIGPGCAINHETGDSFRYTMDFYDGTVSCPRCLEAM